MLLKQIERSQAVQEKYRQHFIMCDCHCSRRWPIWPEFYKYSISVGKLIPPIEHIENFIRKIWSIKNGRYERKLIKENGR